ncbi:MAG: hypothetical protein MJZ09_01955 [Bacteroidales bacterium]|nr:hypothetical protein [Bacteroidales bacterium]MCQ2140909.1 hypothetical protein [Bacteroidales bacterium]
MKIFDSNTSYSAPEIEFFEVEEMAVICNSPNHPGEDLPWFPGDDDEL